MREKRYLPCEHLVYKTINREIVKLFIDCEEWVKKSSISKLLPSAEKLFKIIESEPMIRGDLVAWKYKIADAIHRLIRERLGV